MLSWWSNEGKPNIFFAVTWITILKLYRFFLNLACFIIQNKLFATRCTDLTHKHSYRELFNEIDLWSFICYSATHTASSPSSHPISSSRPIVADPSRVAWKRRFEKPTEKKIILSEAHLLGFHRLFEFPLMFRDAGVPMQHKAQFCRTVK